MCSEEDLNKALKGVLTNKFSFKKASKVYGIPIGTLHRYKKKMHPGNIEVKKMFMTTTQVSKFLLGKFYASNLGLYWQRG